MKKFLQIILLTFATVLGFYVSIFGASELAKLLGYLQPEPVAQQDALLRVALFLISTFFAEALWERMTTFNQIDNIEKAINRIDPSILSERIAYISEAISRRVAPYFDRYLPGASHQIFHELFVKYSFRGVAILENPMTFTVNTENSLRLWRDCLIEADNWSAISYAPDLWTNNGKATSIAHQEAHTKLKGTISRVFVFDDDNDMKLSQDVMHELALLPNTEIKWILKAELQKSLDRGAPSIKRPELLDFAIIDPQGLVLWFRLKDGTKELVTSALTINPSDINQARLIFDIALAHAKEVKP
jgi:hypothetical protein